MIISRFIVLVSEGRGTRLMLIKNLFFVILVIINCLVRRLESAVSCANLGIWRKINLMSASVKPALLEPSWKWGPMNVSIALRADTQEDS
jgi:hypothetical protein